MSRQSRTIASSLTLLAALTLAAPFARADEKEVSNARPIRSTMIMTVENGVRVWRPSSPAGHHAFARHAGKASAHDNALPPFFPHHDPAFYALPRYHHHGAYAHQGSDHGVRTIYGGRVTGLALGAFHIDHRRGHHPRVGHSPSQPLPGWVARPPARVLPFGSRMGVGRGRH